MQSAWSGLNDGKSTVNWSVSCYLTRRHRVGESDRVYTMCSTVTRALEGKQSKREPVNECIHKVTHKMTRGPTQRVVD